MGKIGGLVLLAALALTACSAPAGGPAVATETAAKVESASPHWITKDGEPFDMASVKFNKAAIPEFAHAVSGIPGYAVSETVLAPIGLDLCEHYASGFDTDDLRASGGESLAAVGEAAKATVCATR
jgi:hypothetical protein